jgi:glycosyltransferase involved in cell wall biosynthesis
MRIAVVNHSRRKVGGAEVYLDSVLPALGEVGHEIALVFEQDPPSDRDSISLPAGSAALSVEQIGVRQTLVELEQWRPDIIYTHGLHDPSFESSLIEIAPSVLYVHNYYGTCISGNKLHSTRTPHVCERRFGSACLFRYFPNHCGGRNPITMFSRYRLQSQRLNLMRRYTAVITNSEHMVRELARHEIDAECVYPFLPPSRRPNSEPVSLRHDRLQLLFAGRMSALKGGEYLIQALPHVQRRLERSIHVNFAGDGPNRTYWQSEANRIRNNQLTFEFPGWLSADSLKNSMTRAHLLVFPSIWPEPFGLSGLEAGLYGVPAVAFAVGGIPEWLTDGVNGHLAPMLSASGLASAICGALSDSTHYDALCAGACRQAHRFSLNSHLSRLNAIFDRCLA